jgi:serine/threonine protein phosphatase PrpC
VAFSSLILLCVLDPLKANQDDYSVTHKFAAESGDILLGIYDGHGSEGHSCANFAKENLPQLIAKYINKERVAQSKAILKQKGQSTKASFNPRMWPKLSVKDYEECCRKGFTKCNQKMHDDKYVRYRRNPMHSDAYSFIVHVLIFYSFL